MKTFSFFMLVLILNATNSFAQNNCGSDQAQQHLLHKNPELFKHFMQQDKLWAEHQNNLKFSKKVVTGKDTVYEIPVVVHMVHSGQTIGDPFNPPDSVIINMIGYLNDCFRAQWHSRPDTGNGGVDVPIKFVLAKSNSLNGVMFFSIITDPMFTGVFSPVGIMAMLTISLSKKLSLLLANILIGFFPVGPWGRPAGT